MPTFDRSSVVGFGLHSLNRLSEKRGDATFVARLRADPTTRFLVFVGDTPVLQTRGEVLDPLFSSDDAHRLGESQREVFLGCEETEGSLVSGAALFAIVLDKAQEDTIAAQAGLSLLDLRSIAMRDIVGPAVLGQMGHAKAILSWHRSHRFCANCGTPSDVSAVGWRRDCPSCGTQHFPRVDPVVIMLAVDGERCLLGRQPRFAPGMYSALAGFLEPGETIEDAVRREIHEEAGVPCSQVAYFASQPWPFPSSLMIGCFARAVRTELVVDTTELEDARWFTRAEVTAMLDGTHADGLSAPKPYAIAHHLLRAFADQGKGVLPDQA